MTHPNYKPYRQKPQIIAQDYASVRGTSTAYRRLCLVKCGVEAAAMAGRLTAASTPHLTHRSHCDILTLFLINHSYQLPSSLERNILIHE